jgi:hypothetical protein
LAAMNDVAVCYWDLGRKQKAKELFVKVLEVRRRKLGEEHPDTVASMNNLKALTRPPGQRSSPAPAPASNVPLQAVPRSRWNPKSWFKRRG